MEVVEQETGKMDVNKVRGERRTKRERSVKESAHIPESFLVIG